VVQYVRLHYFTHEATAGLAQVVASAEAEGQHVAGYVLDLRNNPGGVFEEAVAIASLFQVCWVFCSESMALLQLCYCCCACRWMRCIIWQ
jgi:hypothetical protein